MVSQPFEGMVTSLRDLPCRPILPRHNVISGNYRLAPGAKRPERSFSSMILCLGYRHQSTHQRPKICASQHCKPDLQYEPLVTSLSRVSRVCTALPRYQSIWRTPLLPPICLDTCKCIPYTIVPDAHTSCLSFSTGPACIEELFNDGSLTGAYP